MDLGEGPDQAGRYRPEGEEPGRASERWQDRTDNARQPFAPYAMLALFGLVSAFLALTLPRASLIVGNFSAMTSSQVVPLPPALAWR
jgi:hypothetical protein